MYQTTDTSKPWKFHLFSQPNTRRPTLYMKGLLAICIFAGFSLCYFSSFPGFVRLINCPECEQYSFIHASYRRAFAIGVGEDDETNISHVLFGIGGSAETWGDRRRYTELWWKPNVTRGFVWLDREPDTGGQPWPETSPPYRVSENTDRFKYTCWYGSRSAVRIARIIKESFELGLENVRWFVMGDDDTVFFTENLVNVLNKYDHRQMYYIGGNSESIEQDLTHSYTMGYGGAGFAISYPLAAELVKILDGCIDRYADAYGSDQKIGGCMSEIGVPLTKEFGFHQVDIRGSPYGLLAAHPLAPLISLHHLDYVQPLFPGMKRVDAVKRLMNSYEFDPTRTLQHTFCYDLTRNWSISISWGYTIQLYPFLVTAKDLNTPLQTFLTWRSWNEEPFTFNTRVMSLDPCERPIIFYFDRVERVGSGNTLTSYTTPQTQFRKKCELDHYKQAYLVQGFNVYAAILHPQMWNKAPRRQCSEIISGSNQPDGFVEVRIRGCNSWESVTPP